MSLGWVQGYYAAAIQIAWLCIWHHFHLDVIYTSKLAFSNLHFQFQLAFQGDIPTGFHPTELQKCTKFIFKRRQAQAGRGAAIVNDVMQSAAISVFPLLLNTFAIRIRPAARRCARYKREGRWPGLHANRARNEVRPANRRPKTAPEPLVTPTSTDHVQRREHSRRHQ